MAAGSATGVTNPLLLRRARASLAFGSFGAGQVHLRQLRRAHLALKPLPRTVFDRGQAVGLHHSSPQGGICDPHAGRRLVGNAKAYAQRGCGVRDLENHRGASADVLRRIVAVGDVRCLNQSMRRAHHAGATLTERSRLQRRSVLSNLCGAGGNLPTEEVVCPRNQRPSQNPKPSNRPEPA